MMFRWVMILAGCFAALLAVAAPLHAQAPVAKSTAETRASNAAIARTLLATRPTTPVELLRAAKILVDLGEAPQALPLIKQLAAKKLDDEVLAALVKELGSAVFLQLARVPALQPDAAKFCDQALAGAQRFARDPARIERLVKQLGETDPEEHAKIVADLRAGGDAAVAALVAVLADQDRAGEYAVVQQALAAIGPVASAPLVAVLESGDPRLVALVLPVLGELNDPTVADYLLAPALAPDSPPAVVAAAQPAVAVYFGRVPTPAQAAARLHERVRAALAKIGEPNFDPTAALAPPPLVWRWDEQTRQIVGDRITARAGEILTAAGLAADARRILPASETIRRLYLTTLARAIAFSETEPGATARLEKARDVIARASIDELQDLLSFALVDDQPAAAAVAARQLSTTGDPGLLLTHTPQLSALAKAVSHADRSLRFAALQAIMKLDPREPYPGAGRVAEALEYFARSHGTPRALVAADAPLEAGRIAGLLAEQGFEPDMATNTTGVLRLAQAASDYEVIYIDTALGMPGSGQLLQRLRSDTRTARVPLALVSLADEFLAAERVARRIPLCLAVMRTHNAPATQIELNRLLQATGRVITPRDVRREQGVQALTWIAELAQQPQRLYDLRRMDDAVIASLDAPGMTEAAIGALANLDTPRAQRTLVRYASRPAAPITQRQAAARAFAENVSRHGTLLKSDEILQQYDLYNDSEAADAATQKVLAGILDAIEARAQADALALEQPATTN